MEDLEKIEKYYFNQTSVIVDIRVLLGRYKFNKHRKIIPVYQRLIDKLWISMNPLLPWLNKLDIDLYMLNYTLHQTAELARGTKWLFCSIAEDLELLGQNIIGRKQTKAVDLELLSRDQKFVPDTSRTTQSGLEELRDDCKAFQERTTRQR